MITRRLSVGSRRTSKGTLGLKDSALLSDAGSMARVKSRVRYADGSTPPSTLDGLERESAGGRSVKHDEARAQNRERLPWALPPPPAPSPEPTHLVRG